MKSTYDKDADAVYLYMKASSVGADNLVVSSRPIIDPKTKGRIILDYDKDENLVGIEILEASSVLAHDFLDNME